METKCLEVKVDGLSIGSGDCGPQRHYHEPARHYDEYHYHDGPRGPEWKHRAKWKHNGKGKPPGHWEKREKVTYEEEWYYTEGHRH
ncbi:hypothetical protein EES38_02025 [Vibrio viridaestus]|uniref:Uncharacterized protein n=1 Tax=Vibrio viridaestus TaxID=2487322 RepID=A0A3N9TND7_9VIBR|nr:hypothetical protein EES38_02025 [Vibrio viridaestus]